MCSVVNKINCILKTFYRKYPFIFFCLLAFGFWIFPRSASANFDYNTNCQQAMQAILDLKTRTAREILQKEYAINPQNGYVIYLEHYCECIELIVTEDIKIYEKLIDSYSGRMEQMDKLDDGSPCNSWLQAEMLFQTGLAQVKFGTRTNGVYKMLSSYERIKDHRKKYPLYWQNQKLLGMFNIILDNIPPFLRWAAEIFGFGGDSDTGLRQLQAYGIKAKDTPGLAEESAIMTNLGFLLARQENEAFKFMTTLDENITKLTLVKYLYANSASFVYRNDLTLKLLTDINQKNSRSIFMLFHILRGVPNLITWKWMQRIYLEAFLNDYTLLDYKKAACNRLSYCYLLEGNMQKYEEYRSKVATVGQNIRERDREAMIESSGPVIPHTGLLKAQLLCDGGYFSQADSILKSINPDLLSHTSYQLEYYYRKGRIYQLTGKTDLAIEEFNEVYSKGNLLPYTFATRSALQLGIIYEELKNYPLSLQWYDSCLNTYNSAHTTDGVEQTAEKGVKRVKAKV